MSETVDSIVAELRAPPSHLARHVAQILVEQMPAAQGAGAKPSDVAAGYRLAADRVEAWLKHGSWPRLRDER